jgi:hypothetical protein
MSTYNWSVFVPGEDLPHEYGTDYLLAEGEEIRVDGKAWIVEQVELADPGEDTVMPGRVTVVPPHEPTL